MPAADPLQRFRSPPGAGDGRRLALVHGNCQAESLRALLDGASLDTVRIPPAHELTAADVPHLHRWLARADVLVSQPIRAGYRGLAIGTAEVIGALDPRAARVIVPVIRDAGLYPEQAIVRPPHDPGAVPPLVAYHSLRTLARAAGRSLAALTPATVRTIAAASVAELQRRERAHATVVVSDLFARPGFALMRTINHPGNPVWTALAARVRARLQITEPVTDPGRPLLDAVHAPRDAAVIAAHRLPDAPEADWRVDGRRLADAEVIDAHLAWYARHPDAVTEGLRRHAATLAALGLQ